MSAGTWLLRVEGVNFDATIHDTNDLSTMRGASLALLRLKEPVAEALTELGATPEPVFSGASQCAFTFERAGDLATVRAEVTQALAEKLQADTRPFRHLTVVADVVEFAGDPADGGAVQTALDEAEALNRVRQFHSWTIDPIDLQVVHGGQVGQFERARPGIVMDWAPVGKVELREDEYEKVIGARPAQRIKVSPAVKAKRKYGRHARQRFYYHRELGDTAVRLLGPVDQPRFRFTQSISDIVADAPTNVLGSPRSKVAVVYADGNGFGKLAYGRTKAFSKALADPRKQLLAAILQWYVTHHAGRPDDDLVTVCSPVDGKPATALRFETLLWGGDEMMFVLPSWLALPFVELMFNQLADWTFDGVPLTHAVGVAIADRKTPIRQLSVIAKQAADLAKEAGLRTCNSVTFEIFESLVPPDTRDGLAPLRARNLGTLAGDDEGHGLARMLAIPGADFAAFRRRMAMLTSDAPDAGFPRSQIYAALAAARRAGGNLLAEGSDAVHASLEAYRRGLGVAEMRRLDENLPPAVVARPIGLELALIAQFWDYAKLDLPVATSSKPQVA